jgi:hypothetical protein
MALNPRKPYKIQHYHTTTTAEYNMNNVKVKKKKRYPVTGRGGL